MAVIRKEARVVFKSEKSGLTAVFRPVYQEHVEAARYAVLPKIRGILETGVGDESEYLEIGLAPYRMAARHLVSISGVKFDDGEEAGVIENLPYEDALEYLMQLADQDAELRNFVKALAEGQKKTLAAT